MSELLNNTKTKNTNTSNYFRNKIEMLNKAHEMVQRNIARLEESKRLQMEIDDHDLVLNEAKRLSAIVEPMYIEIKRISADVTIPQEEKNKLIADIEVKINAVPLNKIEPKVLNFENEILFVDGESDPDEKRFGYNHFIRDINNNSLEDKFKDYTEVCGEENVDKVRKLEEKVVDISVKMGTLVRELNALRDVILAETDAKKESKLRAEHAAKRAVYDVFADEFRQAKKELLNYVPDPEHGFYFIRYDKYRHYKVGVRLPDYCCIKQ